MVGTNGTATDEIFFSDVSTRPFFSRFRPLALPVSKLFSALLLTAAAQAGKTESKEGTRTEIQGTPLNTGPQANFQRVFDTRRKIPVLINQISH